MMLVAKGYVFEVLFLLSQKMRLMTRIVNAIFTIDRLHPNHHVTLFTHIYLCQQYI